jgi:23S rRNA pseudouridine1911/1915/1917 synthase
MSDRHARLVATPDEAGRRLDVFITSRVPDLSRAQVQRLIREGHVQVPRGPARPGRAVTPGLVVDVNVPEAAPAELQPEALPLRVLHDDADIVVIDKAPGIVVHPAAGHAAGTLVNALLHHVRGLSGIGGRERPGIVHRLDRGTSGVMVVAKHDRAHRALAQQFRERQVGKTYLALVWGTPRKDATLDRPIGRDPRHRQKMSTRARRARPALTRVIDVEALGGVSLVRVAISTGRTHQIRVHLSEAGHPVVGDEVYGGRRRKSPARFAALSALARPFLHASTLSFAHPADGRPVTFEAPLPEDLVDLLAALRRSRPV